MTTKVLKFTSKTKVKVKLPKLREGKRPHKAYFCHVQYEPIYSVISHQDLKLVQGSNKGK